MFRFGVRLAAIAAQMKLGLSKAAAWLDRPTGAYLSFAVFALVVMGRPWEYWDLPTSDTASYYYMSGSVLADGRFGHPMHLVFSPLYLVFMAIVRGVFSDPHAAVIVQRCISLLLAGITVLMCARRVLPSPWSWFAAAWWMAVPENSRPLFEVHVFSFGLFLLGCWLAGSRLGLPARAGALGIFTLVALTLRNELALAVAIFAAVAAVHEWRHASKGDAIRRCVLLIAPSVVVFMLTVLVVRFRLEHGSWRDLSASFQARQKVNLSQVFAFGYQQRHPEWRLSPWTESGVLMQETFGKELPTVGEAWRVQPRELWEHTLWNFRLVPAGLQLALFGAHSGAYAPGFDQPHPGGWLVLVGSLALLAIYVGGLLVVVPRPSWQWLDSPHHWTWISLIAAVPTSIVAIATQRPRPSYIYSTTLLLLFIGVWLLARLIERLRAGKPLPKFAIATVVGAAFLLVLIFGHWPKPVRILRRDVDNLATHARIMAGKDLAFCSSRPWAQELSFYLCTPGKRVARTVPAAKLLALLEDGTALEDALGQLKITSLFLTDEALSEPRLASLVSGNLPGWQLVGASREAKDSWVVLEKQVGSPVR